WPSPRRWPVHQRPYRILPDPGTGDSPGTQPFRDQWFLHLLARAGCGYWILAWKECSLGRESTPIMPAKQSNAPFSRVGCPKQPWNPPAAKVDGEPGHAFRAKKCKVL